MKRRILSTFRTFLWIPGFIVIVVAVAAAQSAPTGYSPHTLIFENFRNSAFGTTHGITYSTSAGNEGAVFSYRNDSRIQYSFNNRFPRQGTLEFLVKIYSGYHYDNYVFHSSDTIAQIFGTDIPGGDVYWPGGMTLRVTRNGTIYWATETKYGQPVTHSAVAKVTRFRFGEWHTIGISYGSEGQYIMVDGVMVYSDPSFEMAMGSAGNFRSPVDVPTIGQGVSGYWAYHRYDGGFNGIVGRFRASSAQKDWVISASRPSESGPRQERATTVPNKYRVSLTLGDQSSAEKSLGNLLGTSSEKKDKLSLAVNPAVSSDASSGSNEPSLPPSLSASVSVSGLSGDNLLHADEQDDIIVRVHNSGRGEAYGVKVEIQPSTYSGLSYPPMLNMGDIRPGGERIIQIPVTAHHDVSSGAVSLVFKFTEAKGFEPGPTRVVFTTKAFVAPKLIVSDVGVEGSDGSSIIEPGRVVTVTARIQNTGLGEAQDVNASVRLGANVFLAEGSNTDFSIGNLAPGQYHDVKFMIYTNNRATSVPVYVSLTEHYGEYGASDIKLPLAFDKPMQKLEELVIEPKEGESPQIKVAEGLSIGVDTKIPQPGVKNPNAIALLLAISSYQDPYVPSVKYAKNDARVLREYLVKTLGFNPDNILPRDPNVLLTYGQIRTYIQKVLPSYLKPDGSSELFVYYTGHGAPSTTNNEAYLVPWDCNPNYVSSDNAYEMKRFYRDIDRLNARKKIIVVDACFSGRAGNGQSLIKYASPALLKVNNPLVAGSNTVIFQSCGPEQVSNWYDAKRHGMFTYFFLKGLQGAADLNGDGRITAEEMIRYIDNPDDGLPYYSNRLYQRPQKAELDGDGNMIIERIEK